MEARPPLQARATEQLFRQLDADGSGQIDVAELRAALLQHGFGPHEAEQMLRAVDTDRSGQVSLVEFKDAFSGLGSRTLGGLLHEWHSRGAQVSVGGDLTGMAAPPAGTPIWRAALAGSSGAAASRMVAAPLEKVTLIMQVSGKTGATHAFTALHETVQREGLRGLWAGAFTNCVRVALFGGCVCVGYSNALKLTPADNELDPMEPVYRSAAGATAGLVASVVTHPLDTIRTRLTVAEEGRYTGAAHAAREAVAREGWRSLWRGVGPAMAAVAPFIAVQQSLYDVTKSGAAKYLDVEPSAPFFASCGVVAGVAAQTAVYPLDVLRRRMQAPLPAESTSAAAAASNAPRPPPPPPPASAAAALRSVLREGGARALFAGIWPSYFRVAPTVAISLVVRDAILGRLEHHKR